MLPHRRVAGAFAPTSQATDEIRRKCIDLLREVPGMPAPRLGRGDPAAARAGDGHPLRPGPPTRPVLDRVMSPAQIRVTAVLALEPDTAARSGELAAPHVPRLGREPHPARNFDLGPAP